MNVDHQKVLILKPQSTGIWITILTALFTLAGKDFLLFHVAAEGFAIAVAAIIFIYSIDSHKPAGSNFLRFFGITYLFIAIIDFLHMITYYGMEVFPVYGPDTPTQLWVAGRYVQSLSLLIAPFFFERRLNRKIAFIVYTAVTGLLVASIMIYPVFPTCYIEGTGLTAFKRLSEYLISLILLVAMLHLYKQREHLKYSAYSSLTAAAAIAVLSEISFTLYYDVYDTMNFIGHILKVVSYFLVYWGIAQQSIRSVHYKIKEMHRHYHDDPGPGEEKPAARRYPPLALQRGYPRTVSRRRLRRKPRENPPKDPQVASKGPEVKKKK